MTKPTITITISRTKFLFIVVFVCLALVTSIYMAAKYVLPWSRYKLLDKAVTFTDPNDVVVNVAPLRSQLMDLGKELGDKHISLYLESLDSGANISVNKDLMLYPMSLAKLPLAIVTMKKVEAHELSLNDEMTIEEADRDNRSGSLYQKPAGTQIAVKDILQILLTESDNTAQHMLLRKVSPDDAQGLIDATGLEDLFTADGRMSAKEYTRFYRALYFSSYLEPKDSQLILTWLLHSTFTEFLSKGIPADVPFAHKYGEYLEEEIYLDSGIIYIKNRPVMLTVMLAGMDKQTAQQVMQKIGQWTYKYFSEYNGI